MLQYEWKKILLRRNGLWLIALLLVAELVSLLFTTPYDAALETHRNTYERYLRQAEGPLTPRKQEWLEAEMLRLNGIHARLEHLKSEYYTGVIPENQFRAEYDALAEEDRAFPGFSKLYTQYIYVREQDNRYFLYTGGWELLLGDREPDYLFLLALVFLLAPVFCQEYHCQMDQIGLTQKRSARNLWKAKVAVALLLTALLTALLQLFDLVFCSAAYGLPHWDYSIQSLVSFGKTEKQLQLWQGFLLQFFLKELGYLYAAVLLLFISVLVKKYVLTLMAGLVSLPLPLLALERAAPFVRIPGPWAFTVGSLYLQGSGILLSGRRIDAFTEVDWGELCLIFFLTVVIIAGMLLIIQRRNTNYHSRRKERMLPAVLILAVMLLSGCTGQSEPVHYNSKASGWTESSRWLVFSTGAESAVIVDKETGNCQDFPPDAFTGTTIFSGRAFFSRDQQLYYLQSTRQVPVAGLETYRQQTALMSVDLLTMQTRVMYHWKNDPEWFFGMLSKQSWEPQPNLLGSFFLHDSYLYAQSNNILVRMDLFTGGYEDFLQLPCTANLAYDGRSLYYLDDYNRLTILNLDSGDARVIEEVVAKDFLLTSDGIYFLNMQDHGTLYYWNDSLSAAVQLDDTEAYGLYWDPKYCWIETMNGLFRMTHDGKNKIPVDCPGNLLCLPLSNDFYTQDPETGQIYCVRKETLSYTVVTYTNY